MVLEEQIKVIFFSFIYGMFYYFSYKLFKSIKFRKRYFKIFFELMFNMSHSILFFILLYILNGGILNFYLLLFFILGNIFCHFLYFKDKKDFIF